MRHRENVANYYWFLGGLSVGSAAALLMAPQAGRRTRRMLRERAEDAAESVVDAGQEWRERAKRIAKGATKLADRAAHVMSG